MRCRNVAAMVLGAIALGTVGCRATRWILGGADEPLSFDHRAHLVRGLSCASCHDTTRDSPRAAHPACVPCHAIGEHQDERCGLCHAAGAFSAAVAAASDLRFSHRVHGARAVPCARCHGAVAQAARLDAGTYRPSMEGCLDCHRGLGAQATDCAVCHQRTRPTTRPESHDGHWITVHGTDARERPGQCAACHPTSDCVRCHQEMAPRDHSEFFLRRGHGLESRWDRERCMACHREDACSQCHRVTPPTSHAAGWAAPTFLHCQSCHFPLEETACAVCHPRAHPINVPLPPRGR